MISQQRLLSVLTDVGLSSNQAKVYLAALMLGPSRPVDIARKAEIKRPTVYPVIESLQKLGLITEQPRGFKSVYLAEKPEKLEAIVEMRHNQLKNSLGELSSLPGLKPSETILKYYEGVDSVKEIFNDMLRVVQPGDDYLIVSNPEGWYELDPEFMQSFIERRARLNLKIRCILWDSETSRDYKKNEKAYNVKVKMLPKGEQFTGNMVIVPQRIWLSHTLEPVWGTTIEHPNIIKFYQELFESWWQSLPD